MVSQTDYIYLNGLLRKGEFKKMSKNTKSIDVFKVENNMAIIKRDSIDDVLVNPEILIYYEKKLYHSKLLRFYTFNESVHKGTEIAELLMPGGKYDYKYDSYFALPDSGMNRIEVAFLVPEEVKDCYQANIFLVGDTFTYSKLESLNPNVFTEIESDKSNYPEEIYNSTPSDMSELKHMYGMNTDDHLIINENKEKYSVQEPKKKSFQI